MDKKLRRRIHKRRVESGAVTVAGVGALFYATKTSRWLFVQRANSSYRDTWGIVGGKIEKNESASDALLREIVEEIGDVKSLIQKTLPIELFTSEDNRFTYQTYVCVVEQEFIPTLNSEHSGYSWVNTNGWPKPLHPGLYTTLTIDEIKNKISTIQEVFNQDFVQK